METDSNTKWSWSGKMIDCNGRTSRFHLGEKRPEGTPFLLELFERDGKASSLEGNAEIVAEGESVTIRSASKPNENESPVKWEAQLKTADAGRYARKSLFGTYESEGSSASMVLARGVIVLWQFA